MDTYSHLPTFKPGTAGYLLARAGWADAYEDGLQRPLEEDAFEENATFTPADLLPFQNGNGKGHGVVLGTELDAMAGVCNDDLEHLPVEQERVAGLEPFGAAIIQTLP